jgi:hypothetical protein
MRTQGSQSAVLVGDVAEVSQVRPHALDPINLLTGLAEPHAAVHHRTSPPLFSLVVNGVLSFTHQHAGGPASANRGSYLEGYLTCTCPGSPGASCCGISAARRRGWTFGRSWALDARTRPSGFDVAGRARHSLRPGHVAFLRGARVLRRLAARSRDHALILWCSAMRCGGLTGAKPPALHASARVTVRMVQVTAGPAPRSPKLCRCARGV